MKEKNDGMKKMLIVLSVCMVVVGIVPVGKLGGVTQLTTYAAANEAAEDTGVAEEAGNETEAAEADSLEDTTEEEPSEEPQEPAFTVTELSATLYAQTDSNVRSGPSKDYDVIGGLATNQTADVTGKADTGWYRIDYQGTEGYVSGSLLGENPVEIPEPQPETPQASQPEASQELQPETPQQPKQRWEYSEEELIQVCLSECITPEMNAWEKAVAINNYLCAIVTYDDTLTHRSTFDALAYGTGVCQGYANAYKKLMDAAGVPTDYVRGYGWSGSEWGSHGWNRVLIDGAYYYVDVTWNDSLSSHQYLLISYDEMARDHHEVSINPQNRVM